MIFQEEFPRNKGKPDELFGGCAAAAVISLFLGSVSFFADAKKKEYTQSTASGALLSPVSLCTVALTSLGVMLLLPRMMNSKHSVEPLLFPSSLSITIYFFPLHYFSVFTVTVLLIWSAFNNNKKEIEKNSNLCQL